jgi:hypothetical protein
MSDTSNRVTQTPAAAAQRMRDDDDNFGRTLSIAVLGPTMSSESGKYGVKRRQIYQCLCEAGHEAFYPEERFRPDATPDWGEAEIEILSSPDVDLVILFQTPESYGVFAEIGTFSRVPEIRDKTVVLTPEEHYQPDSAYLANLVSQFSDRIVYTERQFRECCLLEDCRSIVDAFLYIGSELAEESDF